MLSARFIRCTKVFLAIGVFKLVKVVFNGSEGARVQVT